MADPPWFADESFWETTYPFMFRDGMVAAAPGEAANIAALTGVSAGALLDLACGPGRHAVAFAKAGFQVTAVDRSPFLLAKAADHARASGLSEHQVDWVEHDMREFVRPNAYDLAICLFTSFGFFDEDAENRLVLQRVHANLRPRGRFVLEMMGKETLARIFEPTGSTKLPGVGTAFMRRAFVHSYSQMENEWTYVMDSGAVRKFSIRHWVYSAREIELMLREAGFSEVEVFGDFERRPYAPGALRLVVVATRP